MKKRQESDPAASLRFQKFRGLKSFRTSPWDPKENLPRDYARIFQFQDFWRTRKHVFRQLEKEETDGAQVGPFSGLTQQLLVFHFFIFERMIVVLLLVLFFPYF